MSAWSYDCATSCVFDDLGPVARLAQYTSPADKHAAGNLLAAAPDLLAALKDARSFVEMTIDETDGEESQDARIVLAAVDKAIANAERTK